MLIEDTCSEGLGLLRLLAGEMVDERVGGQRGRARNESVLARSKAPHSSSQAAVAPADCPQRAKSWTQPSRGQK